MATPGMPFYEIPKEFRDFAEKNFEQARTAFEGFAVAARQAVHNAGRQMDAAVTNTTDVRNTAMRLAEQNIMTSFQLVQKLLSAKDPQEVVNLQSDFVKKQIETLNEQAKQLAAMASKIPGSGV